MKKGSSRYFAGACFAASALAFLLSGQISHHGYIDVKLSLIGFVSGLFLMAIGLLSSIRPLCIIGCIISALSVAFMAFLVLNGYRPLSELFWLAEKQHQSALELAIQEIKKGMIYRTSQIISFISWIFLVLAFASKKRAKTFGIIAAGIKFAAYAAAVYPSLKLSLVSEFFPIGFGSTFKRGAVWAR